MNYPEYYTAERSPAMISSFGGYNKSPRATSREFFEQTNIGTEDYPCLAPRLPRDYTTYAEVLGGRSLWSATSIWHGNEEVIVGITEDNKLFGFGAKSKAVWFEEALPENSYRDRQIVKLGADIVIFPDKIKAHINKDKSVEITYLANEVTVPDESSPLPTGCWMVDFASDNFNEMKPTGIQYNEEKPEDPKNGDYWLDFTRRSEDYYGLDTGVLLRYSSTSKTWVDVYPSYVCLAGKNIGKGFENGDVVTLDFADAHLLYGTTLKGERIIEAHGDDFIVVQGVVAGTEMNPTEGVSATSGVKVSRKVPDCDFITEGANRIWGCKYGYDENGGLINEIYASSLGNPTRWATYEGIATDSYAVTIGEQGPFTGAITYNDVPHFFKERSVIKIMGTMPSNYETVCYNLDGVEAGSHKSLANVDGTLLYKSKRGIMAYNGSYSSLASDALGDEVYKNAIGGELDGKYYVCLQDSKRRYALFTFCPTTNLWAREDYSHVWQFIRTSGGLFALSNTGRELYEVGNRGAEEDFEWSAETCNTGLDSPDSKYVSRIRIRADVPLGAHVEIALQFDGEGEFIPVERFADCGLGSRLSVPMPRRCDTFRIRFSGKGKARIYSIAYDYEGGSDV